MLNQPDVPTEVTATGKSMFSLFLVSNPNTVEPQLFRPVGTGLISLDNRKYEY